jgi:hypothetical protein
MTPPSEKPLNRRAHAVAGGTGRRASGFLRSFPRPPSPSMNKSYRGRTTRPLTPHDLRLAADAFEAALHGLDESVPIDPFTARRTLARYVIEHVFDGERDPGRLSAGALEHLMRAGMARSA